VDLPLCYYPGAKNFEIAPNFLKNLVPYLCVQSLMRIIFKPDNWQEARNCPFLEVSRPTLGAIVPPNEWVLPFG
jgi:hypothetical protein